MKLYGELCELEIVQSKKNPENKSVYQSLSLSIREACTRFTNQLSVCKTHLKKPTAKARGKAKAVPPKNEEEDWRYLSTLWMQSLVVGFMGLT